MEDPLVHVVHDLELHTRGDGLRRANTLMEEPMELWCFHHSDQSVPPFNHSHARVTNLH